ncbi:hypothetical protein GGX14DRAFT_404422 [Mycena pura]|uniref:Uncharacterized protein n=1 Tax=Mycena pura TaxID=153505 RepID=A0AAD6UUD0_9AGAR|nr:hypothetical protein GGX14DRAFT_404422 [Mycena pura]
MAVAPRSEFIARQLVKSVCFLPFLDVQCCVDMYATARALLVGNRSIRLALCGHCGALRSMLADMASILTHELPHTPQSARERRRGTGLRKGNNPSAYVQLYDNSSFCLSSILTSSRTTRCTTSSPLAGVFPKFFLEQTIAVTLNCKDFVLFVWAAPQWRRYFGYALWDQCVMMHMGQWTRAGGDVSDGDCVIVRQPDGVDRLLLSDGCRNLGSNSGFARLK